VDAQGELRFNRAAIARTIPDAQSTSDVNFIAPFVVDPNSAQRILAGGRSLWRTEDAGTSDPKGSTWQSIKRPSGSLINAIAILPTDSNRVWLCHNRDGEVSVSEDATSSQPTWATLQVPGFEGSKRRCNAIALDPSDSSKAYFGFGGYDQPQGLWRIEKQKDKWTNEHKWTNDGWIDLSAGLVQAPVRTVSVHPTRSEWVYVGTDVGLMASDNGGKTWCAGNEGPVNTAVTHLTWSKALDGSATLIAATYGRGLFAIRVDGR
jgi:hypothetical protein